MKFINLTPHEIVYFPLRGEKYVIPSAGLARVVTEEIDHSRYVLDGEHTETGRPVVVDFVTEENLGIVGLPEPELGVCYIVSTRVFEAMPDRDDLVVPADIVQDDNSRIIGCQAFRCRPEAFGGPAEVR